MLEANAKMLAELDARVNAMEDALEDWGAWNRAMNFVRHNPHTAAIFKKVESNPAVQKALADPRVKAAQAKAEEKVNALADEAIAKAKNAA